MFNMLFLNMAKGSIPMHGALPKVEQNESFGSVFRDLEAIADTTGVHQKKYLTDDVELMNNEDGEDFVDHVSEDELRIASDVDGVDIVTHTSEQIEIYENTAPLQTVDPKTPPSRDAQIAFIDQTQVGLDLSHVSRKSVSHISEASPKMTIYDPGKDAPSGDLLASKDSTSPKNAQQDPLVNMRYQPVAEILPAVPRSLLRETMISGESKQQKLSKIAVLETHTISQERVMPFVPVPAQEPSFELRQLSTVSSTPEGDLGILGEPSAPAGLQEKTAQLPRAGQYFLTSPKQALQQITEMIVVSKPQEVELSLSPQELGKLRVTIAQTDQGMLVSLMAEREPTLALMRRNIEDLSSALIELGHEAPQFTFSQFSDGSENKHSAEFNGEVERGEPLLNQENLHDTEHTTGRMVLTQYGLDLRL